MEVKKNTYFEIKETLYIDKPVLAVTPDEAAVSLIAFIDKFDISMTGEYWAPRGPR